MSNTFLVPDYIFETSWEVCNKVGGIYTVLATRANTLQECFRDKVIFIGPDLWIDKENPLFIECNDLYSSWKKHALAKEKLSVRIGRWNIPGNPIVILVDFAPFFQIKNEIYAEAWNNFKVDSLHAYGDYDEASMFSYAAAKVVESLYRFGLTVSDKVIYQAHEWMTGMGALYLQKEVPEIATIFTTHATSIGRSIAGNLKPLYDYLPAYNGDQMATELNMESKHSIEKQTAHHVDCFTTVSDITNIECKELLDKEADVVLMNGFEDNFVPKGRSYSAKRKKARTLLLKVANKLLGTSLSDETLLICTSGRYEFKNKGIDLFIESLNKLKNDASLEKDVVAFITVPAWVAEPRKDLLERLNSKDSYSGALELPFITHWLHNTFDDSILSMINNLGIENGIEDKVKVIFVPCYLDGVDGVFNTPYYDLLLGYDLTVYPSYYEPWGYTPLESVAFGVPTISTDLAGFGLWVKGLQDITHKDCGAKIIHRSDSNYWEAADAIKNDMLAFSKMTSKEVQQIRKQATALSEKALWKHFIKYYNEAYNIALCNALKRQRK